MKQLEERILKEGQNLGNGILKVDGFVNHQVDPVLMNECGKEFARRFASLGATKVLTAEISGIAPALTTAMHLALPVVYARKSKPITMPDQVYLTLAPSHTKGRMVELIVSPEFLADGDKVLVIDDFLASGATILGLVRLAEASGAKVIGIGALIEKLFEGGREALKPVGVPVESLAFSVGKIAECRRQKAKGAALSLSKGQRSKVERRVGCSCAICKDQAGTISGSTLF